MRRLARPSGLSTSFRSVWRGRWRRCGRRRALTLTDTSHRVGDRVLSAEILAAEIVARKTVAAEFFVAEILAAEILAEEVFAVRVGLFVLVASAILNRASLQTLFRALI